jgi:hypothetical protein
MMARQNIETTSREWSTNREQDKQTNARTTQQCRNEHRNPKTQTTHQAAVSCDQKLDHKPIVGSIQDGLEERASLRQEEEQISLTHQTPNTNLHKARAVKQDPLDAASSSNLSENANCDTI